MKVLQRMDKIPPPAAVILKLFWDLANSALRQDLEQWQGLGSSRRLGPLCVDGCVGPNDPEA